MLERNNGGVRCRLDLSVEHNRWLNLSTISCLLGERWSAGLDC